MTSTRSAIVQHGFRLRRSHKNGNALRLQGMHDLHNIVLGANVHATGRLGQDQHLGQLGQPSCQRHLLLVAAGKRPQVGLDRVGPNAQPIDVPLRDAPLRRWPQPYPGEGREHADRDVLVNGFIAEQHRSATFRDEADPGALGRRRAADTNLAAFNGDAARVRG